MPQTTNTGPQDFCVSLPWSIEVDWFDRDGLVVLDDDRRARLTLEIGDGRSLPTVGHYQSIKVEVVSKTRGPITSKVFPFDEYLGQGLSDRTDGRDDYPLGENACFMVIDHCGWDWYIAVPARPEDFTETVERWIGAFR